MNFIVEFYEEDRSGIYGRQRAVRLDLPENHDAKVLPLILRQRGESPAKVTKVYPEKERKNLQ